MNLCFNTKKRRITLTLEFEHDDFKKNLADLQRNRFDIDDDSRRNPRILCQSTTATITDGVVACLRRKGHSGPHSSMDGYHWS